MKQSLDKIIAEQKPLIVGGYLILQTTIKDDSEILYTIDRDKSPSGATGGPEAASPEMPDIPGVQTGGKFRPVTIIKYYEERTVQQDGKTKSDWKNVSGPYSRPQVCRSIVIIYFE